MRFYQKYAERYGWTDAPVAYTALEGDDMEQAVHADASMDAITRRVAALAPGRRSVSGDRRAATTPSATAIGWCSGPPSPDRECKVEMPKAL